MNNLYSVQWHCKPLVFFISVIASTFHIIEKGKAINLLRIEIETTVFDFLFVSD